MASPNIHLAWHNIILSMLLSLCHHITFKAEAQKKKRKKDLSKHVIEHNSSKEARSSLSLNKILFKDACSCECMTYLTYFAVTQHI